MTNLTSAVSQDIRFAFRTIRRAPAVALTAVVTLALGIGANTAIFTAVRAVLLNSLEYRDPDRLVYLTMTDPVRSLAEGQFNLSQFDEIRSQTHSFEAIAAYGANGEDTTLSGAGVEAEPLKGVRVSADFLDVLGVHPLIGRSFLPAEDVKGGQPVVMISAALWQRRFGGDPNLTGRSVRLDATSYTVVGVLPAGFQFPFSNVDVWFTRPAEWSAIPARYHDVALLKGFGRLKAGVALEQAQAEMDVISRQYAAANPGADHGLMRVVWLKERLTQNVRPTLWMLFGAVGFVLLIGCANVANLLLAKATSRRREFALRAALGASRLRLIGQLLVESLLLALAGGALGVLLASWCVAGARGVEGLAATGYNPLTLPGSGAVHIDGLVLFFTLAVALGTAVVCGLSPALQVSSSHPVEMLRESGTGAGSSALGRGMVLGLSPRAFLVIGQVGLTVILLIGATLLMRSILRLRSVDPGFDASHLVTMKVSLPVARYDTPQKRIAFYDELLRRTSEISGVREGTLAKSLPTTAWIRTTINQVEGQPAPDERDAASYAVVQSVGPNYFKTLGIPLRRGRTFTARDNAPSAPKVIIVNESLAKRLWREYPQGVDPVGQHMGESYDKAAGMMEVVGIVADIREGGLASGSTPEFYVPYVVQPPQAAYLAVRMDGDPLAAVKAIRSEIASVDSDLSASEVRTMEAVLERSLGNRRWTMLGLGVFAALALTLAAIGIYGVISYTVVLRTNEIGVRRALGASDSDVLRLIVGQALGLTTTGVVMGVGGALALSRLMMGLLFEVSRYDPETYGGITLLVLVVATAASIIPAWRASRIDPTVAIRV